MEVKGNERRGSRRNDGKGSESEEKIGEGW